MAAPQYVARDYSGGVVEGVQLTAQMGSTDTSFTIASTTGWVNAANNPLGTLGPFTVVIDQGTPSVEKILCSAVNLSSGLVTVYTSGGFSGRGYDQTAAQAHVPGASPLGVQPCWSAVEAAEANAAVVFGPGGGGAVVGLTGNPVGDMVGTGNAGVTSGVTVPVNMASNFVHGSVTFGSNGLLIPVTGYYDIVAGASWNMVTAGGLITLGPAVNTVSAGGSINSASSATGWVGVNYNRILHLTSGQRVTLLAAQYTGNAQTLAANNAWLSLSLVSV